MFKYKQIENVSKNLIYFYYVRVKTMREFATKALRYLGVIVYEVCIALMTMIAFLIALAIVAVGAFYFLF